MKLRILLALLVLLSSCNLKNEEVKATRWKYAEGYHLGDVLDSVNLDIRKDTIYYAGVRRAIVKRAVKRFDGRSELKIESLKDKKLGRYVSF